MNRHQFWKYFASGEDFWGKYFLLASKSGLMCVLWRKMLHFSEYWAFKELFVLKNQTQVDFSDVQKCLDLKVEVLGCFDFDFWSHKCTSGNFLVFKLLNVPRKVCVRRNGISWNFAKEKLPGFTEQVPTFSSRKVQADALHPKEFLFYQYFITISPKFIFLTSRFWD